LFLSSFNKENLEDKRKIPTFAKHGLKNEKMEQIREYYRRFCYWQQTLPHYANRHEGSVQHCNNCGNEFHGNFCPICGQRTEVGRVGWNSIKDNIAILWGLDSRSLSYTIVQLLGRPGYLVRDYISGHRQVSFPPVKMLVIICLFMVIIETLFHLENDVLTHHFEVKEIDDVIAWINSQKSWATLLVQSIILFVTHRINKRTYHNSRKEILSD
jgi:hypothetical protein